MEKQAHYLEPHKTTERWTHLIFLDVQTTSEKVGKGGWKLTFCYATARYHNVDKASDQWQTFLTPDTLWPWIESHCKPKRKVIVLTHNFQTDLLVTGASPWFPAHGWIQGERWLPDHGPQGYATFRKNKASLWVLSSANYFPVHLGELAKMIRVPYKEIDCNTASREERAHISKVSVEIVSKVCLEFFTLMREENLGRPAKTLAGWAMNCYRLRFLQEKILVHIYEDVTQLEIAAYHGGRVECFKVGTFHGYFWLLDVRSMYPYLMKKRKFPTRLVKYFDKGLSIRYLRELVQSRFCIADVTITAIDAFYPYVADRRFRPDASDGQKDPVAQVGKPYRRVCFPQGTFRTALCGETLQRACEQECIVALHRLAIYERGDIFSGYVDEIWKRRRAARLSGNRVYEDVWKRMLNVLHGKFGQRVNKRISSEPCPPDKFEIEHIYDDDEHILVVKCFGLAVKISNERVVSWNSVVSIAAATADYGRNYLWSLMSQAGVENCLYADTDSLMVNDAGKAKLERYIGSGLGALKVDLRGPKAIITAPKDYLLGDRHRMKGVKSGANFDPYTGKWKQTYTQSLMGALSAGRSHYALKYERSVKPGTDIWGRQVLEDGTTVPWTIGPVADLVVSHTVSEAEKKVA
jgi:hypothetical protein